MEAFDEMLHADEIYALCVYIGNALFRHQPLNVVFQGTGLGKSTMCKMIQQLAKKNYVQNVIIGEDSKLGDLLKETQVKSICIFPEIPIPNEILSGEVIAWQQNICVGYTRGAFQWETVNRYNCWNAPVFACTNQKVSDLRIKVIHFDKTPQMKRTDSQFLEKLDLDLIEKKCMLALSCELAFPTGLLK